MSSRLSLTQDKVEVLKDFGNYVDQDALRRNKLPSYFAAWLPLLPVSCVFYNNNWLEDNFTAVCEVCVFTLNFIFIFLRKN